MRKLILFHFIIYLLFIIMGCTSSAEITESEDSFELHDIYSYEYNSIETEHNELITNWMNESRLGELPISYYSLSNDQNQYRYEYVFAKGYKEFEITFIYSESRGPKGSLHIVGIKGEADDEVLVKIKYDSRYIFETISSDQMILPKNKEL